MSSATAVPAPPTDPQPYGRRVRFRTSLLAHSLPMVWLNGGALAVCLVMIVGLLLLVFYQGIITFWPGDVIQVGTVQMKVKT